MSSLRFILLFVMIVLLSSIASALQADVIVQICDAEDNSVTMNDIVILVMGSILMHVVLRVIC